MLFRKKKKEPVTLNVKFNTESAKKYTIIPDEEIFVNALALHINPRSIILTRLSDGTLNVTTPDAYLGKVRLQGKKKYIQCYPDTFYADTVDELIKYIPLWFK